MTTRRTETLAKIPLFRSLEPAKIELLDSQCTWCRAERNQWVLDYQDTSNDVFFVISGTLRVKIQAVSGREVLLRELNAGQYFGEIAAIDNQPRSSGIFAVTDVTFARMPAGVFRATVHAHPDVCDQLLQLLAGYVRTMSNRVNEYTTLDARHRIYAELLRLSKPETGKPKHGVVSPPPVHSDLAARVSIRRESVTRELKALERAGLIEKRRGALVLTDTARLRQMIAEASELD
jgi:CRP/FNR family cyclic AMP-dependent transcriptional regulator